MRKVHNNKKKINEYLNRFFQKINRLYVAIIIIITVGVVLLVSSYWIPDADMKNIAVGLGTGVVTSALVTLYIEIINSRIERKKVLRYKRMLLNPLYRATKNLYIHVVQNVNEYRVREGMKGYFLLPLEDTAEISDFFKKLKEIEVGNIKDEAKKKRLESMANVSLVFYSELISQYKGIPFESLLLDNIITQDEYEKLKYFSIINECSKCLNSLNSGTLSEQEMYYTRIQIMHGMFILMNRIMKMFDFVAQMAVSENKWIIEQLDYLWYNEIYVNSDEYIEKQIMEMSERAEAEAEYYAEHPELLEPVEESEEDILYRKINTAIWAGDAEKIKECFPQIDKNNKEIQSELTWSLAKDVMKDRELRRLYYEKYGVKYKVQKEKRRKKYFT